MLRFGLLGKAPRAGTASQRRDREAPTAGSLAVCRQPTPTTRLSWVTDGPEIATVAIRMLPRAAGAYRRRQPHAAVRAEVAPQEPTTRARMRSAASSPN